MQKARNISLKPRGDIYCNGIIGYKLSNTYFQSGWNLVYPKACILDIAFCKPATGVFGRIRGGAWGMHQNLLWSFSLSFLLILRRHLAGCISANVTHVSFPGWIHQVSLSIPLPPLSLLPLDYHWALRRNRIGIKERFSSPEKAEKISTWRGSPSLLKVFL